jgi:phospholipid transport system substrate-binding protein
MQEWYRRIATVVALSSLLLARLMVPVEAGEPTDKIRETVNAVMDVLADESLKAPNRAAERRAKVRQAVLQRFGFEEMAQRAMGQHWRKRTPQEQQEFVALFSDLLERSYIDKIEGYGGGKQNIRYAKETTDKDGYASVRSEIVSERGQTYEIEYRLLQRNGNWQVYDIVIEGVSLVNNYRTQFNKVILEKSYEQLVKQMKLKQEQEKAATGSKS